MSIASFCGQYAPTLQVIFENIVLHYIWLITTVTTISDFRAKMHKKLLVTGLCMGPQGELTVLPGSVRWI